MFHGHAVRALLPGLPGWWTSPSRPATVELLKTVEAQWESTIARRTYLTGGMGSRHFGEAFGEDWELPSDRAYSETCAGVASFMLSHRLLLATGDVRYADLAERTLYNVLATSPALDGRSFFYANPLQVRVPAEPLGRDQHRRRGRPALAVVHGVLLPEQHRPHVRLAARLPRGFRGAGGADPPLHALPRSGTTGWC